VSKFDHHPVMSWCFALLLFHTPWTASGAPDTALTLQVIRRQAEFENSAEQHPNDPEAWGALGDFYYSNLQDGTAIRAYGKAHDLAPRDVRWTSAIAVALRGASRIEAALPYALEAEAQDPKNTRVKFLTAVLLEETGRLEEATSRFHELRALLPQDPKAAYHLGRILLQTGRFESARDELLRALVLEPENTAIRAQLAMLAPHFPAEGWTTEALEPTGSAEPTMEFPMPFIERMLSEVSDLEGLRAKLSRHREDRDWTAIRDTLVTITSLYPEQATTGEWIDLAAIENRLSGWQQALSILRSGLFRHPQDPELLATMAEQQLRLKDYSGAEQSFTEALRAASDPTLEARAQQGLGRIAAIAGDLDGALSRLETAQTLWPGSGLIQVDLARVHGDLGDFDAALQHLARARELGFPVDDSLEARLLRRSKSEGANK
jgi:Flp pilus assembly protein TadD